MVRISAHSTGSTDVLTRVWTANADYWTVNYDLMEQLKAALDAGGITIINDCYNAAPASVSAALRVLCAREGRKIAVLGDIKDLGTYAEEAHRNIGKEAEASGVDAIFAFGENARWIADSAKGIARHYDDIDALNADLGAFVKAGDNALIKASRAMKLERVTNFLTERK